MAKKKDTFDGPEAMQAYLREQINGFKIKDVELYDSVEMAASDVGLYLPHLSLRYLFQRNVFPLERVALFFGPPGSNKSSLLYYFYRLFGTLNYGMYQHLEVEDKDTPEFRLSMTDWDKSLGKSFSCATIDDYQRLVSDLVKKITAVLTSVNGPGRRVPYVLGIDSLTAKMTAGALAVVEKAHGVTERRFADEARSLSDWFKTVPALLQNMPISLIAINHDKPAPGKLPGQVIHKSPGGAAPLYHATYRIYMEKRKKIERRADGYKGNVIKLVLDKNSLGTDKYTIDAEVRWGDVAVQRADGSVTYVQHSLWDWDKATGELLARLVEDRDDKSPQTEELRDTLGLGRSGKSFWSKALGIKQADAVRAEDIGKMIEQDGTLKAKLDACLSVRQATVFNHNEDFLVQIKKARANSAKMYPSADEFRAAISAAPVQLLAPGDDEDDTDPGIEVEGEDAA